MPFIWKGTAMKKALIIATTVAALGASAVGYTAYAQQQQQQGETRHRLSAADMTAFADARIAALKTALSLTADQQKLWTPVETTLRELSKKRIDAREKFRAEREANKGNRPDAIERMRVGADRLAERSADLKKLADVSQPLYASLDDSQKRRFNVMARMAGSGRMHMDGRGGFRRFGDNDDQPGDRNPGGRQRINWDGEDTSGSNRI